MKRRKYGFGGSIAVPPSPQPASLGAPKSEHDWQAEDDARTLQRAAEIMSDEGRHDRAHGQMQQQHAALGQALSRAKPRNPGGNRVSQGFRRLK